jgi:hypothetical protein
MKKVLGGESSVKEAEKTYVEPLRRRRVLHRKHARSDDLSRRHDDLHTRVLGPMITIWRLIR